MICKCTNCSGEIEFDDDAVGQTTTCPHCGFDSSLYDCNPGKAAEPTPAAKEISWWKILKTPLVILGLFLGLVLSLWVWGQLAAAIGPRISEDPDAVGRRIGAFFLSFLVLIIGGFWLFFPIFVFDKLNRIIRLLKDQQRR